MFALLLLVLILSLAAATQYFAHAFQYHAALGANLGHLYAPWKVLQWVGEWGNRHASQFTLAGSVGMMVAASGLLLLFALKKRLLDAGRAQSTLHGSARWADRKDIAAAGLLPCNRSWLGSLLDGLRGQGRAWAGGVGSHPCTSAPGWTSMGASTTCATAVLSTCCAMRPRARARGWD
jgi:type IV secretion system protein VirD4